MDNIYNKLLFKFNRFLSKRYFLIFEKTFVPVPENTIMRDVRNFKKVRYDFIGRKNNNLRFLLKNRYEWMNKYIKENDCGVEVGAGAALSRFFIRTKNYVTTDYNNNEWLDIKNINAVNTPFSNNSFDFVIASNMLHHIYSPVDFLREMYRILKPGGRLIIQDVNMSFFTCAMLRLTRHEGYSFEKNVFDNNELFTDPNNLWTANCAVSNLLFDDKDLFYDKVDYFKIIKDERCEFLMFINSGGVNSKIFYIPLPSICLNIVRLVDNILVYFFPNIFALQRKIVLSKLLIQTRNYLRNLR